MRMIPPSANSIAKKIGISRFPNRRLACLGATAAVASIIGVTLGSTLRFQVTAVSQAPLFQPQQDFPPLAKWPPQVPPRTDLNTGWSEALPESQWESRRDRLGEDIEYADYEDVLEPDIPDSSRFLSPDISGPSSEWEPQEVFEEATVETIDNEAVSPLSATVNVDESGATFEQDLDATASDAIADPNNWFHKQPMSESQLSEEPFRQPTSEPRLSESPTLISPQETTIPYEDLED